MWHSILWQSFLQEMQKRDIFGIEKQQIRAMRKRKIWLDVILKKVGATFLKMKPKQLSGFEKQQSRDMM